MEQNMTNTPDTMADHTASPLQPKLTVDADQHPQSNVIDLNKTAVFDALASSGITQIVVLFDGYGDSGQIEDVSASNGEGHVPMPEHVIKILQITCPQSEPIASNVNIASAVEMLVYDVLAQTHVGWENCDGAYGDIVLDVLERTITLDYNERFTTTENFTHIF
jgi:hypothetical protein